MALPTPYEFNEALEAFVEHLNKLYGDQYQYEIDPKGKKYKRIVKMPLNTMTGEPLQSQKSVHGFAEISTGNLFKAAGWKSPTKNFVRGNVMDSEKWVINPYSIS